MFENSLTNARRIAIGSQKRLFAKMLLPCLLGVLGLVAQMAPPGANAQATGQVSGVVTDPSGSVVPKAKVELISPSTAQIRVTTPGADGSYTFPLVNPGTYKVQVSAAGFRTSLIDDVEVLVNGTTRTDAKLLVGSTSEEVTVTGAAPLVETSNATMGNVVEQGSIVDLPLNGRNFRPAGHSDPRRNAFPHRTGRSQPGQCDCGWLW